LIVHPLDDPLNATIASFANPDHSTVVKGSFELDHLLGDLALVAEIFIGHSGRSYCEPSVDNQLAYNLLRGDIKLYQNRGIPVEVLNRKDPLQALSQGLLPFGSGRLCPGKRFASYEPGAVCIAFARGNVRKLRQHLGEILVTHHGPRYLCDLLVAIRPASVFGKASTRNRASQRQTFAKDVE
jgi:hypothetical protein